jgi:transcriptional regulator with XRE-family HTH domain
VSSSRRFPQALRAWRRNAGVSQADLDTALGRSPGTIAQIEVGRQKPPDKATCAAIAAALLVPAADVWRIARDERLRLADEDAFLDFKAEMAEASTNAPLDVHEADLLRLLRALDCDQDYEEGTLARVLSSILTPLVTDAAEEDGPRARLAGRVVWALMRTAALPVGRVRRLLVALIKTVEAVVNETAPSGRLEDAGSDEL